MKKHTRIGLMVLITVVLLLAMAVPGLANNAHKFNLEFCFGTEDPECPNSEFDWDHYSIDFGEFSSTGAIEDEGDAFVNWSPIWAIFRGTMIFENEANNGEIVLRYNLSHSDPNNEDCTYGRFQIYPSQSSGIYDGLWGVGDIEFCRPGGGNYVVGELNGIVQFPSE